jgi:hypothetical protein
MERASILVFVLPIMLLLFLSMLSGVFMIVGGLKMLRLQSYGWAMTACVVAVLPFNPVGFIGLIIGIWGLVVLNQPSVRAAFGGLAPRPKTDPPASHAQSLWLIILALVGIGLVVLVPIAAILAWWLMHF